MNAPLRRPVRLWDEAPVVQKLSAMEAAIREAIIEGRDFRYISSPIEWFIPPSWDYAGRRADERMEHLAIRPDARA